MIKTETQMELQGASLTLYNALTSWKWWLALWQATIPEGYEVRLFFKRALLGIGPGKPENSVQSLSYFQGVTSNL